MIQFNLLPDVKLDYIRARRTKRTVMLSSILIAGASVALFLLFFSVVNVAQKQHLKHLQNDIDTSKKELQAKPDLAKILTIQNQLGSLPSLHQQKPVATRAFTYIQQLTPQNVSISSFTVNFTDQTVKIEGSADALSSVNTFADTLKFTNFTVVNSQNSDNNANPTSESSPAFTDVVLSSFDVAKVSQDKKKAITYTITLTYKPEIFSGDKDVKLLVTSKITTRSETEKPSAVFQTKPTEGTN
jgi:Tfp pilus assembly protein PilN